MAAPGGGDKNEMEHNPSTQQSSQSSSNAQQVAAPAQAHQKDDIGTLKRLASSPAASPFSKGPVSKKQLADNGDTDADYSLGTQESLAEFLATDHPASENKIKEMLLSLKCDLQADLCKNLSNLQSHIEQDEERVDNVERKMGDFTEAHNSLADWFPRAQH